MSIKDNGKLIEVFVEQTLVYVMPLREVSSSEYSQITFKVHFNIVTMVILEYFFSQTFFDVGQQKKHSHSTNVPQCQRDFLPFKQEKVEQVLSFHASFLVLFFIFPFLLRHALVAASFVPSAPDSSSISYRSPILRCQQV